MSDLPEIYPLFRGQVARHYGWHRFNHVELINSNIIRNLSDAAYGVWHKLTCYAYQQDPCGALPDDDAALAWILHKPLDEWRSYRQQGVLYGWRRCLVVGPDEDPSQGVPSLMHHKITEEAMRMIDSAEENDARRRENSDSRRLTRLREKMVAVGVPAAHLQDEALILTLDQMLKDAKVKRRTMPLVRDMCRQLDVLPSPPNLVRITSQ